MLKDTVEKNTFEQILITFNLFTTIKTATRCTDKTSTLIDNIITNINSNYVTAHNFNTTLSDHNAQTITVANDIFKKALPVTKKIHKRSFNQENLDQFYINLLNETWDRVKNATDTNSKYNAFLNTLKSQFEACFPKRQSKIQNGNKHWITPELKDMGKQLKQLHQQIKYQRDSLAKAKYQTLKNTYRKNLKSAKCTSNNKFINAAKNKSKAIWQIVRNETHSKQPKRTNNIELNILNEPDKPVNMVKQPQKVATAFNSFFINCHKLIEMEHTLDSNYPNDPIEIMKLHLEPIQNSMTMSEVTEREIVDIVYGLKNTSSCGWDEIPLIVIKKVIHIIKWPLAHIFNHSLATGNFPENLKRAVVTPLYKKDDPTNINNYRPISLLPIISKILETIVKNRLCKFLENNKILSNSQHGFQKNKSTTTALAELENLTLKAIDKGNALGIFCDLSKAFDCVHHNTLLKKLEIYGIRDITLKWFESYLTGRKQKTKIRYEDQKGTCSEFYSDWLETEAGVPQGSVLSPTIFLLYINDIQKFVEHIKLILFADDITALIIANCLLSLMRESKLAAKQIQHWLTTNKLSMNVAKTNIIQFHLYQKQIDKLPELEVDNFKIVRLTNTGFLGVTIDENLNWESHLKKLTPKLSSACFALRVIREATGVQTAKIAYHAYFESFVRYGIQIWGSTTHIDEIFKIQKRAVRILGGLQYRDSCTNTFKSLELLTVPCIYIYELLKHTINHKSDKGMELNKNIHQHNTRQKDNFHIPRSNTTRLQKGSHITGIILFNNLPENIRKIEKKPSSLTRSTSTCCCMHFIQSKHIKKKVVCYHNSNSSF